MSYFTILAAISTWLLFFDFKLPLGPHNSHIFHTDTLWFRFYHTFLYILILVDATHPPQRPWIPLSHPERNKPTGMPRIIQKLSMRYIQIHLCQRRWPWRVIRFIITALMIQHKRVDHCCSFPWEFLQNPLEIQWYCIFPGCADDKFVFQDINSHTDNV